MTKGKATRRREKAIVKAKVWSSGSPGPRLRGFSPLLFVFSDAPRGLRLSFAACETGYRSADWRNRLPDGDINKYTDRRGATTAYPLHWPVTFVELIELIEPPRVEASSKEREPRFAGRRRDRACLAGARRATGRARIPRNANRS